MPAFLCRVCKSMLVVSLPGSSSNKPLFECRLSVNSSHGDSGNKDIGRARVQAETCIQLCWKKWPLGRTTKNWEQCQHPNQYFFFISRQNFLTKEDLQTKVDYLVDLDFCLVSPAHSLPRVLPVNLASWLSSCSSIHFCSWATISTVSEHKLLRIKFSSWTDYTHPLTSLT